MFAVLGRSSDAFIWDLIYIYIYIYIMIFQIFMAYLFSSILNIYCFLYFYTFFFGWRSLIKHFDLCCATSYCFYYRYFSFLL